MLIPLSILFFVLAIYIPGISHSVYGADSGDIILASWFGGVAHPPGYPLNTMIGWLFTHLPYAASVVYKAGVMSAFLQALTIGLIFLLTDRLVKNKIVALAASLTLAFSPIFWLYAHVAEVFQLLNVLVLVSVNFLIIWYQSKGKRPYRKRNVDSILYASFLFLGLSFFHHHTAILLAPAWIYLVYKVDNNFLKKPGNLLRLAGFFLLGILPYIFVFTAVSRDIPIKWDNPTSFTNFFKLITRADYGTFVATSDFFGSSFASRLINALWYFKVLKADFTWFGIGLFLIGFYSLFKKNRHLFWFLTLAIFFSGPFFFMYASFPPFKNFILGILERFFMLSYLFWTIVFGFGLSGLIKLTQYFFRDGRQKVLSGFIVSCAFLLIPMSFFLINKPKTDLSNYQLGSIFSEDLLRTANLPGIIFLEGDTPVFNTQYSYYVDGVNKDSVIIISGSLRHLYYRDIVYKQYPQLKYPDDFLTNESIASGDMANKIIELNWEKFPIYSNANPDKTSEDFVWINQLLLLRLYKEDAQPSDSEIVAKIQENLKSLRYNKDVISGSYLNFIPAHISEIYLDYFVQAGYFLIDKKFENEAVEIFEYALQIDKTYPPILDAMGSFYANKMECNKALDFYERALVESLISTKSSIYTKLGNLYRDCFKDEKKAGYYSDLSKKIIKSNTEFR